MPEYSEDQIRKYAHQLWQAAGETDGKSDDFWHRAKTELQNESHETSSEIDDPKPMPE